MAKRDLTALAHELQEAIDHSHAEVREISTGVEQRVYASRDPALIQAYQSIIERLDIITRGSDAVKGLEDMVLLGDKAKDIVSGRLSLSSAHSSAAEEPDARGTLAKALVDGSPEHSSIVEKSDAPYLDYDAAIHRMEEYDRASGKSVKARSIYRVRLQKWAQKGILRVKKGKRFMTEVHVSDLQERLGHLGERVKRSSPSSDTEKMRYIPYDNALEQMRKQDEQLGRPVLGESGYRYRIKKAEELGKLSVKRHGKKRIAVGELEFNALLAQHGHPEKHIVAQSPQNGYITYKEAITRMERNDARLHRPRIGSRSYYCRIDRAEKKGSFSVIKRNKRIVGIDEREFAQFLNGTAAGARHRTRPKNSVRKTYIPLEQAAQEYASAGNNARVERGEAERTVEEYRGDLDYALRRNAFSSEIRDGNAVYVDVRSFNAYMRQTLKLPESAKATQKTSVRDKKKAMSLTPIIEQRMQGRPNTIDELNIVLEALRQECGFDGRSTQCYRIAYKKKYNPS